jgi:hypothetical protein
MVSREALALGQRHIHQAAVARITGVDSSDRRWARGAGRDFRMSCKICTAEKGPQPWGLANVVLLGFNLGIGLNQACLPVRPGEGNSGQVIEARSWRKEST